MLLRFGVENHRSIRNYQEILLTASRLKDTESGLLDIPSTNELLNTEVPRAVPVVAIYGANASGKSTMLDAIRFFRRLIVNSHSGNSESRGTPFDPFLLDDQSREMPSTYTADIALENIRYQYGFTITAEMVAAEWLYSFPIAGARKARTVLFYRDSFQDEQFHFGKSLKGENKQIAKFVRSNSLFLSVAAQNAHPLLSDIYNYFSEQITTRLNEASNMHLSTQLQQHFEKNTDRQISAIAFLKAADIGVNKISFVEEPVSEITRSLIQGFESVMQKNFSSKLPTGTLPNPSTRTAANLLHEGENGKSYVIELKDESNGTKALLSIIGPVLEKLQTGGIIVIDELNSTLHPLVCRQLIELFSNSKTNRGKAQLIFSTHDTNLLSGDLMRRDQIWFCEKDRSGTSHFYSMADIKVRGTDNLEKGYLTGRFGAIPFAGNLRGLDLLSDYDNQPEDGVY